MKKCPYCSDEIQDEAIKCKHCGEWLKADTKIHDKPTSIERKKGQINELKIEDIGTLELQVEKEEKESIPAFKVNNTSMIIIYFALFSGILINILLSEYFIYIQYNKDVRLYWFDAGLSILVLTLLYIFTAPFIFYMAIKIIRLAIYKDLILYGYNLTIFIIAAFFLSDLYSRAFGNTLVTVSLSLILVYPIMAFLTKTEKPFNLINITIAVYIGTLFRIFDFFIYGV